jgi:hypothetical protein
MSTYWAKEVAEGQGITSGLAREAARAEQRGVPVNVEGRVELSQIRLQEAERACEATRLRAGPSN